MYTDDFVRLKNYIRCTVSLKNSNWERRVYNSDISVVVQLFPDISYQKIDFRI